ncbi:MAG: tRNA (N6-isopentenyl adenosine(37)-C2)-methylthiotransferase MiaB [Desulfobulbaceae bacterium A2]|nr:MAG: tRNA (N6-isopentenyl adenosine(37)-C2)-methylthiotransferase MiaB [Desulfobulbaceae bacterium A2]
MKKQSVYIKTFGCQMNERDSDAMLQLLLPLGYEAVASPEMADVVLLNTCAVRAKAEQKVYSLLGQLRRLKMARPEVLLGVAGCVAQLEGARLFVRASYLDLVLGPRQVYRLPQLLQRLRSGASRRELALDVAELPEQVFPGTLPSPVLAPVSLPCRRFITIMQGCDNYCSYCVVPTTRGREISRPMADILQEVEWAVACGVRDITLLGQNVNSYGQKNAVADFPVDFPVLLRRVAAIPGLARLRFTTSHPKDLGDGLMRCFAEVENLCPHLHLPVQSGADLVLARMNRGYSRAEYLAKVARLRQYRPDIVLSTDVIVGFPGETEEDFQATLALMDEVRFHSAFTFKYSDRVGTVSIDMDDKINDSIKARRLALLQGLQDRITLESNQAFVGQTVRAMVEQVDRADLRLQGRAGGNQLVHFPRPVHSPLPQPGDIVAVRIMRGGQHALLGEMV